MYFIVLVHFIVLGTFHSVGTFHCVIVLDCVGIPFHCVGIHILYISLCWYILLC